MHVKEVTVLAPWATLLLTINSVAGMGDPGQQDSEGAAVPAKPVVTEVSTGSGAAGASGPFFVEVADAAELDFVGTVGSAFAGLGEIPSIMQRNMGNGGAVGDYDGDGDLDVFLCAYEGFVSVMFRNNHDLGEKTFTNVTVAAGLIDLGLSRMAHFADLDNNGDLDLILLNDNDLEATHPPSRIFRNEGDGTFEDVTAGSGFEPLGYLRCGMSLADYDNDGLLDIYVTNWGMEIDQPPPLFPGSNRLYRNLGNFQFEDVTDAVGLGTLARDSFSAIFHDFDGDQRPDLYVAVDHTSDEFYWNTPGGFVNVTKEVGTTHVGNDMGVACADFDDDGDLDMYTTNVSCCLDEKDPPLRGEVSSPMAGGDPPPGNCLYINKETETGDISFLDEAEIRGVLDTYFGWGVEFIDVENDGDLDIFAVNGFDEFVFFRAGATSRLYQTPSVLFVNVDGTYEQVNAPGMEATDDSRGLIAFDYDRDGDEDLLIMNVGQPVRLLENQTPDVGHWLDVKVLQTNGNRNGIGVTIYFTQGELTKRREIIVGDSYLAGTPAEVHFGLGDAMTLDELVVEWTDGRTTTLIDVAADQLITIEQPLPIEGDLDGDGDVDFNDLLTLLAAWGDCPDPPDPCPADLDESGAVDFADILILLANWG